MAKGISLHIGLNSVDPRHYGGWSGPLNACEADAEDMEAIAKKEKYETTLLLTNEATRDNVVQGITRAAEGLGEGDIFFLSYSGHGGQIPDEGGDEDDLEDETWCLYDGEMIDDELRELWAKFQPGVRVLVLSDSCHSGTVVRMAYDELATTGILRQPVSGANIHTPMFRAMPDEMALRTFRQNRTFYQNIMRGLPRDPSQIRATVRLISGCQDNQLSQDGTFNGLFTGTLLRVWAGGRFEGNYHQFHSRILRRMPPTQSPNHFVTGLPNPAFDSDRPFRI